MKKLLFILLSLTLSGFVFGEDAPARPAVKLSTLFAKPKAFDDQLIDVLGGTLSGVGGFGNTITVKIAVAKNARKVVDLKITRDQRETFAEALDSAKGSKISVTAVIVKSSFLGIELIATGDSVITVVEE